MTEQTFSIAPHLLPKPRRAKARTPQALGFAAAAPAPDDMHYGDWHNEAGEAVGARVEIGRPGQVVPESPGRGGRFARRAVPLPLAFAAEPPATATHLLVSNAAGPVARLAIAALGAAPARLAPPRTAMVGPPGSRFVFPVIAERFDDWDVFLAKVQELYDWVLDHPPFNEAAVAASFALEAIFWRSDPVRGMFGADDAHANAQTRLFFGDLARAKKLIDPWIAGARASLILINSSKRGGAGGMPGFSAWASTAAAPGEAWQAIGLHEIGHGLGLADEYLDTRLAANGIPAALEPNVSRDPRAGNAPWSALINVPADASPSHKLDDQLAHAGDVGTFQGARYREDLYRPMQACLMHDTGTGFCVVCQQHIRETI